MHRPQSQRDAIVRRSSIRRQSGPHTVDRRLWHQRRRQLQLPRVKTKQKPDAIHINTLHISHVRTNYAHTHTHLESGFPFESQSRMLLLSNTQSYISSTEQCNLGIASTHIRHMFVFLFSCKTNIRIQYVPHQRTRAAFEPSNATNGTAPDGTLLHPKESDSGIVAGIFIAVAAAVVMIMGFVSIVVEKAFFLVPRL